MQKVFSFNGSTTVLLEQTASSAVFDYVYNDWVATIGAVAFSASVLGWNRANWEASNKKAMMADAEVAKEQALYNFDI